MNNIGIGWATFQCPSNIVVQMFMSVFHCKWTIMFLPKIGEKTTIRMVENGNCLEK